MSNITIRTSQDNQFTCVPNIFIDRYMQDANGEFVKIYLYLLRALSHKGCSMSISDIADCLDMTEKDVRRGLSYWEKHKLLHLAYDVNSNISCIDVIQPCDTTKAETTYYTPADEAEDMIPAANDVANNVANGAANDTVAPADHTSSPVSEIRDVNYTMEQLASFKEEEHIQELIMVVERYMKCPLSYTALNTLYSWYDQLNFSADLIEYLVESCVEKGHPNVYYMNRVAISWHENGISTVEEARQSANVHSQTHYSVMKAMGISGRTLVKAEVAYIDKWTKDFGFSLDIINEACSRTIRNTGRASFEYADTILTNWHDKGIQHLEDIGRLDQEHDKAVSAKQAIQKKASTPARSNRFNNFEQRTYSDEYYEELERKMLRKN